MSKEIHERLIEAWWKEYDAQFGFEGTERNPPREHAIRMASNLLTFVFGKALETAARVEAIESELKTAKAIINVAEDKLRECGLSLETLAQTENAELKKKIEALEEEARRPQAHTITITTDTSSGPAVEEIVHGIQSAIERQQSERRIRGPDIARRLANQDERDEMNRTDGILPDIEP